MSKKLFFPIQTNFTAGQLSPRLHGRVDINKYNNKFRMYGISENEEYIADLSRFIIELSQIDQTRLNDIYLEKYLLTTDFLYRTKNNMDNFKFYGRDMETLFSKVKIAHSRRVFCKPKEEKTKIYF